MFYLRYKLLLKSNFLIFVHFFWNVLSFILIFSFLSLLITYVLHSLGMPLPDFINDELIKNFSNFVLISAPLVGLMKYFSTEKWFINVFRDPFSLKKLESNTNYKERLSFRENFHSDFNEIIKSYVGDSKVYVFIDDLDRCEVPKAAELMQAINLMISDNSKVYFSLAMDRKVISAGLAAKNEKVIDYLGIEGLEYGYDFIEKFIQLPFKVPSPKSSEFVKFLTSVDKTETSLNPSEPAGKSSISEKFTPDKSPEIDLKSSQNKTNGQDTESENSNNVETESNKQEIKNCKDCVEDSETSKLILEMVASALDNNPRRIKQFINLFRFQRTIGKRIGLFSYDESTDPKYMWNCKKVAKFVAISINWPSLISDLGTNITLLEQLQKCALKPKKELKNSEGENETIEEYKNLERWTKDEKLMKLLRHGCVEGGTISKEEAEYTLSGLNFSKLLEISPEVTSSISLHDVMMNMEFALIPAGEFMMGSPDDEVDIYHTECPQHKVTIKNPFYLGKYPITQKEWIAVMGNNPSSFKGDDLPVESVSWDDVQEFIKKLNKMEGTDKYCLPSEAEWEYACRAGTTTRYSFDDESKLNEYAWYGNNSGSETHPVGKKVPNSWGLYDMHGNVWEWVEDKWHEGYNGAPIDGSAWEDENSSDHVLRGGGWYGGARYCRSASRDGLGAGYHSDFVGFRLLKKL